MKDYSLKINGHNYDVKVSDLNEESKTATVVINGRTYDVEIGGVSLSKPKVKPQVARVPQPAGGAPVIEKVNTKVVPGSGNQMRCPLPGTITDIKVSVGAKVSAGDTLLVLEAMKMENNIDSDFTGVVKEILVQKGATVMEGETLVVIE